ncbi:uncharacterized protein DUF4197 [Pseudomonas duriflava]|uniref:Uncharacterized protein DUF4197 n=1 Tax=Pseudomonas duriflava TaxID=459528 RepID=A0A562QPN6_9PSED|nr:DUF4197 domain-containing protein [Pseudomonas duriflava]TWI58721.1 uncharacterized protein DUF4197 [Pseudomonas duriflava]
MKRIAFTLASLMLSANAFALSLANFSQQDSANALKDALTQGAQVAIQQLGKPGGFTNDPEVRIELPGKLARAAALMKQFGMGAQVTQLENSMNQAAEAAVPQAQALLVDAVKKMTVQDAKGILSGGNDAATQYLDRTSREQLRTQLLPIIKQTTDKVGLTQQYNNFAGRAASFGVIDAKSANVESYVTEQALNGLFKVIADQERTVRENPAAAATSIARKVFGVL